MALECIAWARDHLREGNAVTARSIHGHKVVEGNEAAQRTSFCALPRGALNADRWLAGERGGWKEAESA